MDGKILVHSYVLVTKISPFEGDAGGMIDHPANSNLL